MLGKAHLTIGMAAAMTLAMPENMPAALPVIAGAAAGSLICDIDCESPAERRDASKTRVLGAVIAAAALIWDRLAGAGMWTSLAERGAAEGPYLICTGIAGLVITLAFASVSSHRGFSHSLLALALESVCIWLVFPQMLMPFVTAFATHLLLDITNKRKVRLFYPAKSGVSLGIFYADRLANRIFAVAGTVWLICIFAYILRSPV